MVKARCVIVLSPRIRARAKLCTVVCLSSTQPDYEQQYHCQLDIRPKLPPPWDSEYLGEGGYDLFGWVPPTEFDSFGETTRR
jgi:hypothetical protein